MTIQRSLRRRRRVTAMLAAAVLVTLAVAITVSRPGLWAVAVLSDVVFACYVGLLIHARNVSAGVEMSARSLGG